MSIQQDINSALGQMGILASLNPTLQQKAIEGAEIRKVKREEKANVKRTEILKGEVEKEKKNISDISEDLKNLSPEKFNSPEEYITKEKELNKRIAEADEKTKSHMLELDELKDRYDNIIRRGYDISPERFRESYFKLRQREAKAEIANKTNEVQTKLAEEAQQRAEQIAKDKAVAKEKRKTYMSNLYKGVNRTLPGFKDMSREQQENIVNKMSPGERRKIANEEKWRNEIYGK